MKVTEKSGLFGFWWCRVFCFFF